MFRFENPEYVFGMTLTTAILVNAMLVAGVVGAMLWLLGHHGIRKGVGHDLRLIRHRAAVAARRVERNVDRDLAA
jgi:hypothetical protein